MITNILPGNCLPILRVLRSLFPVLNLLQTSCTDIRISFPLEWNEVCVARMMLRGKLRHMENIRYTDVDGGFSPCHAVGNAIVIVVITGFIMFCGGGVLCFLLHPWFLFFIVLKLLSLGRTRLRIRKGSLKMSYRIN